MRQKNAKTKRSDIQYLRGVAIAAVLGFHLRPEVVPQGFLGVDMFFVISGYLMTSILNFSPQTSLTMKSVLVFYERRMKRLFPAYFLVILLTLFICGFFLITFDFDFLRTDALWATFFSTNFQSIFEKKTYFLLVSEYKFLLHTWSLSVEFQYYLIAPFLIYAIHSSGHPLAGTVIVGWISLAFQVITQGFETISFGFVFSRIWQFLVGSFVFYLERREISSQTPSADEVQLMEDGEKNPKTKYISKNSIKLHFVRISVIFSLFAITFMPLLSTNFMYTIIIRVVATVLAGIAMYVGWDHEPNSFSKALVYFGDISYSVYLIHWPVIVLAKYVQFFELWSIFHSLGIIFPLTIIQYESFEKKLLKASSQKVFAICTILTIGIVVLQTQPQGLGYLSSIPHHPAIVGNQKIASSCENLEGFTKCNWDSEMLSLVNNKKPKKGGAYFCSYDGPGKATVFFTGNSFALRQLPGIKESLKGKYKKLYYAARPACLAFESFNDGYDKYWQCDEVRNKTVQFLKKFKPDFLVITQKLSGNDKFKKEITMEKARNDSTTLILADYLKQFSPFVKRIFIIEPHPTLSYNPATSLAKQISQGKSIDDYYVKIDKIRKEVDPGWFRILAAMETCPKCVPISIRDAYCKDNKCPVYEEKTKLSLFCDNAHLSPHGVEKMVPLLKSHFSKALTELRLN